MAQKQYHPVRSRIMGQRQVSEVCMSGPSGSVPGNKKSAGWEAVAFSVGLQAASIAATGKDRVVAIPAAGFGQAFGGTSTSESAAHITNRSSSFRPSASTGRAKARRLA